MLSADLVKRIGLYKCSECDLPVILNQEGNFVRACHHDGAIIAPLEAVATGDSSVNQPQAPETNGV